MSVSTGVVLNRWRWYSILFGCSICGCSFCDGLLALCKTTDVTCDDFSGETPPPLPPIQTLSPKFSKKGEGGQNFSHKRLGVLSKDEGVSVIFTLTNTFWCYLYQCVFFICINHSISILYVFFMVVLIYIYVCVRVYQYIGPWVCSAYKHLYLTYTLILNTYKRLYTFSSFYMQA